MLFSSLVFILMFLPLFFLVYYFSGKREIRNGVLFLFSLIFYAWGEPFYVLLMLVSLTMNYFVALEIERNREKGKFIVAIGIALNLILLGIFKYLAFFVELINLFPKVSIPVPEIALPIGISFYTFQILSYIVDVYRGETHAQQNYIMLGAYLCAFPQLIAGPIVRYVTVEDELRTRTESLTDITDGIRRFILGLSKKVLIANTVAAFVDSLLSMEAEAIGTLGAWLAVIGYTLQIYYDFSGYSDMSIGLGRMMGFHYLENFRYPYAAVSVTDFWRRWHISLSTFFRDYVYIPLGGNRVSKGRWICNLLIVWFLTGMWHGAGWNYILWGLYYGVILILEKLFIGKILQKLPGLNRVITLLVVMFGWVLFRLEDMTVLPELMKAMVGGYGATSFDVLKICGVDLFSVLALVGGIMFSFPIMPFICEKVSHRAAFGVVTDVACVVCLLMCLLSMALGAYNPFIYFKF